MTLPLLDSLMAKKKREETGRKKERFELRVERAWLDRVERQADRYGMTAAAYVRFCVNLRLESDEASIVEPKG